MNIKYIQQAAVITILNFGQKKIAKNKIQIQINKTKQTKRNKNQPIKLYCRQKNTKNHNKQNSCTMTEKIKIFSLFFCTKINTG